MEQALKKQIADAEDKPALQQHLQAALAAELAKKRDALPVKHQRAQLLPRRVPWRTRWTNRPSSCKKRLKSEMPCKRLGH
eukprot:4353362-Amphidinium_carterae.1